MKARILHGAQTTGAMAAAHFYVACKNQSYPRFDRVTQNPLRHVQSLSHTHIDTNTPKPTQYVDFKVAS